MTVRNDQWPYIRDYLGTRVRMSWSEVEAWIADQKFPHTLDVPTHSRRIPDMDWDDFALYEPKPWKMQPGDLGLSA